MGGGGVTRVLQAIGVPVMLSRVRRQRCATTGCANKSRMALTFPLSDIGEDGGPGIGAIVQCAACIEGAVVKVTDGGSRVRTYVLNLTEDELVAVFTECNCCSDRDAHESATGKASGLKLPILGSSTPAGNWMPRSLPAMVRSVSAMSVPNLKLASTRDWFSEEVE